MLSSMVLKVMSGDKINIRASSWYRMNGQLPGAPVNPVNDILGNLLGGVAAVSHGKATAAELSGANVLAGPVNSFLSSRPAAVADKPKAFLNWILFDEQFQYVSGGSGADAVGGDQAFKIHALTGLPVTKNGYIYVYVSNDWPCQSRGKQKSLASEANA